MATGTCIDCKRETKLIKGRCNIHYWQYRDKINKSKPRNKQKEIKIDKDKEFFDKMLQQAPRRCQETNLLLSKTPKWVAKSQVAHILPKRHFESIRHNELNIVYLNVDVHTNFDNLGKEYIKQMKIYPLSCERVSQLIPFISQDELKHIPDYYLINQ